MSSYRVSNVAEDGQLVDPDAVELLRKKIDKGIKLDFTAVVAVSAGVLDSLFEDISPEHVADLVAETSAEVDLALAAWVDRKGGPVIPAEKPRTPTPGRSPKTPTTGPAPLPQARPVAPEERYTPNRLMRRLHETLRSYIESAYPLSDPTLIRARRTLLETEADGHLLAQEPYIETTTRYASSPRGYADIGLPTHIAEFFCSLAATQAAQNAPGDDRTILFPSMYLHQEESFRRFLVGGKDIVVATGTGSGKTECFLVPMLGNLFDEAALRPTSFAKPGVRALVLYPMNALVNDQLARLRLILGDPAVGTAFQKLGQGRRVPRFGMYTGRTPYPGPRKNDRDSDRVAPLLEYYLGLAPDIAMRLRQLGRFPAKDLVAFYAKHEERKNTYKTGKNVGKEYTEHHWDRRLHTGPGDRELLTRQEMVHGAGTRPGHSPDVLVTNYSMLEYMLMRPFERPIFDETRAWLRQDGAQLLLVLDEAHMYRGAKGAEVAFLIRRLRARLGIHDRPEKLRVIATSASLGSDDQAKENVRRFAADIIGKSPQDFDAITGTREVPTPAQPAPSEMGDTLAALDIDGILGAFDGPTLREKLAPLLPTDLSPNPTEAEVLRELHRFLKPQPWVNQLIKEAAGHAVAISELAERVFPGHPRAMRALEGLLTVSTLAREKLDDPGLVPTRVHGLFRGLQGLYACVNPRCSGRQSDPGQPAMLGRLYASARTTCADCQSRVFEIASCRSCGSPYLLGYATQANLGGLSFLWGETEGASYRIELLPHPPRYGERTQQIRLHMTTGFVDTELNFPDAEVCDAWLWLDDDGNRALKFANCAMCQPSAQSNAHIFDFRTRGEQPFTALIEAQFAAQPPQKADPRLPNHGRKVLVFSDGRQKAARLAPALEHSHARDLFRQVLALAADKLKTETGNVGVAFLYPAFVWHCANNGIDPFPFPEKTGATTDADRRAIVEFRNQIAKVRGVDLQGAIAMGNRARLKPVSVYAQSLFEAFTDRYYSIQSLALATVEEDPTISFFLDDFPDVGLDPEATKHLFRAWIRQHLERRSFRPHGAAVTSLGEGWAKPVGIDASKRRHVLPFRFEDYLARLLEGRGDDVEKVFVWFQSLVRAHDLFETEDGLYYLTADALSLNLRLEGLWLRCGDCGRIHPEAVASTCPACLGAVVAAEEDYLRARVGYYRDQVNRAFQSTAPEPFGLAAAEHSAQLTGDADDSAFNKVEEYELRFQDVPLNNLPPIDVLSCTTTMEVGIDIGSLSGVALRNVPPHVANYQQRAGRAGRRGRSIASVITYAQGSTHDAHFFEHPADMISGTVRSPVVYIENQDVLARHVNAYLVQRFFHERVPADSSNYDLFGSLGKLEQFIAEEHPCSLLKLEAWLDENEAALKAELTGWAPNFGHALGQPIAEVSTTIDASITRVKTQIREVLPLADYSRRNELTDLEQESLARQLDEPLLETLIGRAVFPRYAFPTDVVNFWVAKPRQQGAAKAKRTFDYDPQRDLQLALTEYAPGRSLTIDKWRFESAALYSPFEPTPTATLSRSRPYTSCKDCSWATMDAVYAAAVVCPVCGSDQLARKEFIRPAGFAPDVNASRVPDRGEANVFVGRTDRARLEPQDPPDTWTETCEGRLRKWTGPRRLVMVNKGVGNRGFCVCEDCGRSEPEWGPGFTATKLKKAGISLTHAHPHEKGLTCTGQPRGPYFLGHEFPTDALLLRLRVDAPVRLGTSTTTGLLTRAARMALTSTVEALALAASRVLQIEEGELSGWWTPVMGGSPNEAQIYLYDLLPGGAGYARAVGNALEEVLDAAETLLDNCTCETSCYRCIRHYGNNWIHASLDRKLALALIRHLRTGAVPVIHAQDKDRSLSGLCEYLGLRQIPFERSTRRAGVAVPLVFTAPSGESWVDVHHPLVDPEAHPTPVSLAARSAFMEAVELDAFSLEHDLPQAIQQLQLPGRVGP